MSETADERLKSLELPPAPKAIGNYRTAVECGGLLYLCGHGPLRPDGTGVVGRVGEDLDVDAGYQAARLAALATLATLKETLGSLDRVARAVKVFGLVRCTPEFTDLPKVVNGFSDLLGEVFGDAGKAARSAVGVTALPSGWAVEIESVFELRR